MASVLLRSRGSATRLLLRSCSYSSALVPSKASPSATASRVVSELPATSQPCWIRGSRVREVWANSLQCGSFGRDGRRHFGASSKESEADGEMIASQMISYAANCRKNVTTHEEVARVLEQGQNFLLSQGPSAANAAGKVMLMLATFHVDGGRLTEAVEVLQQAAKLEGASVEICVSACQALVGVLLRAHKDSDALSQANSMVELVDKADGLPLELGQELGFRASATVVFVELASGLKASVMLPDMGGLSSWLNDKEAQLDGVAAAVLGFAECAHMQGHFSQAKDYYERAAALAESSMGKGSFGLSAGAMTAEDVVVGAEAGLGQVEAHLGDFDAAEVTLTKALAHAEQINGDKHRRVGAVLACIADVYAQRGKGKGSGDLLLTEGLYRKGNELLGAPSLDTPGQAADLSDVMAISRARLAGVLDKVKSRESEAQKLQAWAVATWKGRKSLTEVLALEAMEPSKGDSGSGTEPEDAKIGRHIVIDVRLGRVFY